MLPTFLRRKKGETMKVTVNEAGEVVVTMLADDAEAIVRHWAFGERAMVGDGPATRMAHAIRDAVEFKPIPRVEAKLKAKSKE